MASGAHREVAELRSRPSGPVLALMGLFFAVQVVYLPGSASAFRMPKESLALVGLAVIVSCTLASRLRDGSLSLPVGLLPLSLGILPLLLAASALWAAWPRQALLAAATTAVWAAAAVWLATLAATDRHRLVCWCLAGATVSAAVMMVQTFGVHLMQLPTYEAGDRLKLTGLTGNPSDLAMVLALLLALALPQELPARRTWRAWVLPVAAVAAILVSQSLTGCVAVAALAGVWLLQHRSRTVWISAVALATLALVLVLASGVGARLAPRLEHVLTGDWYALFSARHDGWTAAAQMIRSHPVLGVGADHYDHAYFPSRLQWMQDHDEIGHRDELATHFSWAHNDPLQLTAETGLLGVAWLVLLLIAIAGRLTRGDPVPARAAAAFVPFALLHYPTHLAASLVPIILFLAHLMAAGKSLEIRLASRWITAALAAALVLCCTCVLIWQARRLHLDRWRGQMQGRLLAAQLAGDEVRARIGAQVAAGATEQIARHPGATDWLWRLAGRGRLAAADPTGAERAFRRARKIWPHEDAEFGLGLALAAQGRYTEAVHHLGQVFRTNPKVLGQIDDPHLRRLILDHARARLGTVPDPEEDQR